jgi:hypothetical protein
MSDFTAAEYQDAFNDWYEDYEIGEFIEYSEENWEKVQKMDPHYIWTHHSTCEDEKVTAGATLYSNSCCWGTFGWYVAKEPWVGDPETYYESYKSSAYLPCETCNPDGEGDDEDFDKECEYCAGEGWINHYFD